MAYYYTNDSGGARGLNRSNHSRTDAPVAINCIGEIKIDRPFVTDNVEGRVDFYLMYILGGKLRYTFEGGECTLGKGSFVIFPPCYRYRYCPADGERDPLLLVSFLGLGSGGDALGAGTRRASRPW